MLEIDSTELMMATLGSNPVVVLDCYAQWCQPCQRMLKILPNLVEELEGVATICKVDVDAQPEIKELYGIRGIPTFIFFKNAQEVHRHTGIMTLAAIKHKVMELQ